MSDAAATPGDSVSHNRINATLLGIIAALAVVNSALFWISPEQVPEPAMAFYCGYLVIQPVLIGVWTALGTGSMVTRLPIATACFVLLWVCLGYFPAEFNKLEQYEFVVIVICGLSLHLISLTLFLIFRRVSGFRFQMKSEQPASPGKPFQFSILYVLCLMTICALDLGMAFNLTFQPPPDPGTAIFGRNFFVTVLIFVAAVLYAAILPCLAVPLCILHGQPTRRAIIGSIIFWVVVQSTLVIFGIDQFGLVDSFLILLLAQLAATIIGSVTAFALRKQGLLLVRHIKNSKKCAVVS